MNLCDQPGRKFAEHRWKCAGTFSSFPTVFIFTEKRWKDNL